MAVIFLEEESIRKSFFPFTYTRSVADLRIGILTIREKWEQIFGYKVIDNRSSDPEALSLPANWIPNREWLSSDEKKAFRLEDLSSAGNSIRKILYPWHIFQFNDREIRIDFELLTMGRESAPISGSNKVIVPEKVFLEKGARAEYAFLNASSGPIYIGKDAEIMEGAMLRGPVAICEGSVVKLGATIYGGTTIGPHCIVGGEIKNSVMFDHSNKAHHGYLGDSVVGSWCNLGAGTSNSNLKNNAGEVAVWVEAEGSFVIAGQKCGLLMGDYSRSAINTSFNTGTVVGICCQLYEPGLTPKFIPSFSWGSSAKYELDKAIHDIRAWKKLKNQSLSDAEIQTLTHIFGESKTDLK
ncbi:MAG: putative sugar nucleotidyl transferase [Chitinophagales bacterium]